MKDCKNQKEEKKVNVQMLKPLFPGDREIIRKTAEDGSVTCQDSDGTGTERETVSVYLESKLSIILETLEMLANVIDASEYTDVVVLFETLLRDARTQLDEMFAFVNEDIGAINSLYEEGSICKRARCIGAFIGTSPKYRTRPYCLDQR